LRNKVTPSRKSLSGNADPTVADTTLVPFTIFAAINSPALRLVDSDQRRQRFQTALAPTQNEAIRWNRPASS